MATLTVEIKSRDIIKPSSPTPDHLKTLKFGFVDQFAPPIFTPFILFYQTDLSNSEYEQKSTLLKQSLSEALTKFYPLAGKVDGNVAIDCNDQGVEFYEANVFGNMKEAVDDPNPDELVKLLPFPPVSPDKTVITGIQVNHFACGGVAISVCTSHKIADGATIGAFVKSWATIALDPTGENVEIPEVKFDTASYVAPQDVSWFQGIEKLVTKEKLVTRRIVMDKAKIAVLKEQCADLGKVKPPSRVEVVTAYIWKKFMDAARTHPNPPAICYASQAVNLRGIPSSSIPENCCGNLFWMGFAVADIREDVKYSELAGKIREAAKQINVDYLEKFKTKECFVDIKKACESSLEGESVSCGFSSNIRFPLYEADFGWGKPIWVSMTTLPLKNSVFYLGTKCGEGVEVWVNIAEKDVAIFEDEDDLIVYPSPKVGA